MTTVSKFKKFISMLLTSFLKPKMNEYNLAFSFFYAQSMYMLHEGNCNTPCPTLCNTNLHIFNCKNYG